MRCFPKFKFFVCLQGAILIGLSQKTIFKHWTLLTTNPYIPHYHAKHIIIELVYPATLWSTHSSHLTTRIKLPLSALINSTVANVGWVFCCTVMRLQIVALWLVLFSYKKMQNFLPWVHSSKCAGVGGPCIKKFDISFWQNIARSVMNMVSRHQKKFRPRI